MHTVSLNVRVGLGAVAAGIGLCHAIPARRLSSPRLGLHQGAVCRIPSAPSPGHPPQRGRLRDRFRTAAPYARPDTRATFSRVIAPHPLSLSRVSTPACPGPDYDYLRHLLSLRDIRFCNPAAAAGRPRSGSPPPILGWRSVFGWSGKVLQQRCL